MTDLELRDILARIDERLMNTARVRQEMQFAPWQLVLTGMTAGAALTVALVALIKIFSH